MLKHPSELFLASPQLLYQCRDAYVAQLEQLAIPTDEEALAKWHHRAADAAYVRFDRVGSYSSSCRPTEFCNLQGRQSTQRHRGRFPERSLAAIQVKSSGSRRLCSATAASAVLGARQPRL